MVPIVSLDLRRRLACQNNGYCESVQFTEPTGFGNTLHRFFTVLNALS
mgnify:CR=1 FL=1